MKKLKFWNKQLADLAIWDMNLAEMAINLEELLTISFNQSDEKSADLCGAYLAYKAGFDPELGKAVFSRFESLEEGAPTRRFDKFFRSHPYSHDRLICVSDHVNLAREHAQIYQNNNPFNITNLLCEYVIAYQRLMQGGVIACVLVLYLFYFRNWQGREAFAFVMLGIFACTLIAMHTQLPCLKKHDSPIAERALVSPNDTAVKMVNQLATVKTKYSTGNLRIRDKPSIQGDSLTVMPSGSELDCIYCCCNDIVNGKQGKWCYVDYNGTTGYAWGWFIQLAE